MDKRQNATPQDLQLIFDRSMSLRNAERNRQGATTGPSLAVAERLEKEARGKWRDAADRVIRQPPTAVITNDDGLAKNNLPTTLEKP